MENTTAILNCNQRAAANSVEEEAFLTLNHEHSQETTILNTSRH
jgi:hypothetical protein